MKRTCAYLITSVMLISTVPAAAPALTAQAAVHATVSDSSSVSVKESGKFVKKGGRTYCLTSDGAKAKGWVQENGKWYYFDKKDGHMVTGWLKLSRSKKFYLKKDGSMIEGPCWYKIGTKKYFFTQNGHVRAAWQLKNGKWYYIDTEGNMVKSKWILYAGQYYYLTKNGAAATGKKTIAGKKYTFSSSCALTGTVPSYVRQAAKASSSDKTTASDAAAKSTAKKKTTQSKTADASAKTASAATKTSSSATKSTDSGTKSSSTAANTTSTTKTSTAPDSTSSSTQKSSATAAKSTTGSRSATQAAITKVVGKLNDLPASKKNFVINIAKYVRKYAPRYGIKVYSPIIAQAIHESGWGESSLAWKYHNYFGLKCGTLWTGKSVNLSTKEEYTAGTLTTIRDNFRVYDNMEQGVIGYFEFIQRDRYSNLKGVTDCEQYLINIKNDGYATGSQYVAHTMNVVNIYNLKQFDK